MKKHSTPIKLVVLGACLLSVVAGCSPATDVSPMPSKSEQVANLQKQIAEVDKSNFTADQKAARKKYLQGQIEAAEKGK